MRRRTFLGITVAAALVAARATAATMVVDVYKSPTCGCCGKWVEHLRTNGFAVTVNEIDNVDAFRTRAGVPAALASCHTARVDGYVVEGHVPAADIRKLLAERPKALGLAVPGMPIWVHPAWTPRTRAVMRCCCSRPMERRGFITRIPTHEAR